MALKDQKVETKEKKTGVIEDKAVKAARPVDTDREDEAKPAREHEKAIKKAVDFFKGLDPKERVAAYAAIKPAINEDLDKLSIGQEADGTAYDNI